MATIRHHVTVDRSPDDVWKVVSDAGAISTWFPGMESSSLSSDGATRTVVMGGGMELQEDVVTNDDGLRRFQYRITGGAMPVDYHLGTIDVLPVGDVSLVVYSAEIVPDEIAPLLSPALEGGLAGLKAHVEG